MERIWKILFIIYLTANLSICEQFPRYGLPTSVFGGDSVYSQYLGNHAGLSTLGQRYDGNWGIPGHPGVDYPAHTHIPRTGFTCEDKVNGGYYADPDTQCQAFHICSSGNRYSFLCPNGSIFNQETFVCDWYYNFDCAQAVELYFKNDKLEAERRLSSQMYADSYISNNQHYSGSTPTPTLVTGSVTTHIPARASSSDYFHNPASLSSPSPLKIPAFVVAPVLTQMSASTPLPVPISLSASALASDYVSESRISSNHSPQPRLKSYSKPFEVYNSVSTPSPSIAITSAPYPAQATYNGKSVQTIIIDPPAPVLNNYNAPSTVSSSYDSSSLLPISSRALSFDNHGSSKVILDPQASVLNSHSSSTFFPSSSTPSSNDYGRSTSFQTSTSAPASEDYDYLSAAASTLSPFFQSPALGAYSSFTSQSAHPTSSTQLGRSSPASLSTSPSPPASGSYGSSIPSSASASGTMIKDHGSSSSTISPLLSATESYGSTLLPSSPYPQEFNDYVSPSLFLVSHSTQSPIDYGSSTSSSASLSTTISSSYVSQPPSSIFSISQAPNRFTTPSSASTFSSTSNVYGSSTSNVYGSSTQPSVSLSTPASTDYVSSTNSYVSSSNPSLISYDSSTPQSVFNSTPAPNDHGSPIQFQASPSYPASSGYGSSTTQSDHFYSSTLSDYRSPDDLSDSSSDPFLDSYSTRQPNPFATQASKDYRASSSSLVSSYTSATKNYVAPDIKDYSASNDYDTAAFPSTFSSTMPSSSYNLHSLQSDSSKTYEASTPAPSYTSYSNRHSASSNIIIDPFVPINSYVHSP